jgi:putative transposase
MPLQSSLTIERMCQLAEVSRAGFYRSLQQQAPREEEMVVRARVQEVVLAHQRRYGCLRVTQELRDQGMIVNHKRVERIMREDNLLAIRYRKFMATTDSKHEHPVYLNLAKRMELTGINQLWVADITYIRLREEFVYLAVVLDAFSRRVVGWALERTLQARLALTALQQAVVDRCPAAGLVHHSDRGVQYACGEYTEAALGYGMLLSMSRAGCPYDNAACESFMKTLKQEEIYANEYRDIEHLRDHLEEFIDRYYNRCRLHSALSYQSPDRFEAQQSVAVAGKVVRAAKVEFF